MYKCLSFLGVIFFVVLDVQSINGLKCWECDGYDETEHQCSPDNKGKSVECTGSDQVCQLVKEEYPVGDKLHGTTYFLRKCTSGSSLVEKVGSCVSPQPGSSILKTHCYCNNENDCNRRSIAGVGEGSSSSSNSQPTGGKGNGAVIHSANNFSIFIMIFVSMLLYQNQ